MSYGWLSPRPEIPRDETWFGLYLKPTLETRWEEFTLARDELAASLVSWACSHHECDYRGLKCSTVPRLLDMGCGFEPGVHMMPEIAAGIGWEVEAIDILQAPGPTHLWESNPPHPKIRRRLMDMRKTDYPDAHFDAVLSISVLEHVSPVDRMHTFDEVRRVLRPGGKLIVTMDGLPPILALGFEWGERVTPENKLKNDLGWPVSFMVGVKQ